MCGIAGILNLNRDPADPVLIARMTRILAHRGPDGEGCYVDGPVALGHRRLAVIDLSPAAAQPMLTPDRRYVICYNGELYNFKELRLQLEAFGHRFFSRSDTEVVLRSLIQWGEKAVPRFNGMFALAFWDYSKQELLLARDRYGIKPLYYAQSGATVVFGSEIKALLEHPLFPARIDPQALAEYFTFQNLFGSQTIFQGVSILPAGHTLRIRACPGSELAPEQYWDFSFREPESRLTPEDYVEELDRLFSQAVTRQLVSDVPVGAYLSGGMDSGSITAVAAQHLPYLHTFTCGFDLHSASGLELAFDEREKAEMMSYSFKTEHYEMVLKAGDMERCMKRLAWHLEEPRVGQSYPNFYAAQLAAKFVKVVLSGTGGDEVFAGYPWRYLRFDHACPLSAFLEEYFTQWHRLLPHSFLTKLLSPLGGRMSLPGIRVVFEKFFATAPAELTERADFVNLCLCFEAKTFLHGLLVVEDKLSMAHGLESRVPFLDNDLIDFALQLPAALKMSDLNHFRLLSDNELSDGVAKRYEKSNDGKLLLRRMMQRYIPEPITIATKQGFSGPDASWFRGESIDYVRTLLTGANARIYNYVDRAAAEHLLHEHFSGRQNLRLFIWSLIYLENMLDVFDAGY